MSKDTEPNLPFERLGDYDVLAPISEGGMGSVWLGRRTGGGELVALKAIRAEHRRNKEFVAMLVDEAGIASRLTHPNILRVRAFGDDGQHHFLVMDLLRGHTLLETWNAAHARGKRLPLEVVAWIGARVADALHCAHELADESGKPLNVVHRDVSPANVFLTKEGNPQLIDFGLAKARDRIASTAIGVVKGKLAYLSPEQTQGRPADRRSDIFSLGVTLWELTLDRRLFMDGSDAETVRKVREAQVPDPASLVEGYPPALAQAIVRALAREPDARWQTAAELRDALDAFVKSTGQGVDGASVRALLADTFAGDQRADWEKLADEVTAEMERTRVWDERKESPPEAALPKPLLPLPAAPPKPLQPLPPAASPPVPLTIDRRASAWSPPQIAVVAGTAVAAALVAGFVVRGCGRGGERAHMEERMARVEGMLGVAEAGMPATSNSPPRAQDAATVVSADDDRLGGCAVAKVAGYQAWQEAMAKAKTNAGPAEAACSEFWSDSKKQACYRAASAQVRATQAARDAAIAGGARAREAVNAVKDDPKNEAIARARAASQAAFAACDDDDGGP